MQTGELPSSCRQMNCAASTRCESFTAGCSVNMDSIYPPIISTKCAICATLERYIQPAAVDESLERIMRRALDDARAKGRDYITQTELAVRAGQQVSPDSTAAEIPAAVRLLQQS